MRSLEQVSREVVIAEGRSFMVASVVSRLVIFQAENEADGLDFFQSAAFVEPIRNQLCDVAKSNGPCGSGSVSVSESLQRCFIRRLADAQRQ